MNPSIAAERALKSEIRDIQRYLMRTSQDAVDIKYLSSRCQGLIFRVKELRETSM